MKVAVSNFSRDPMENSALSYRVSRMVTEVICFRRSGARFARCPRCRETLAREYVAFCDRCGQRLDWSELEQAVIQLR